MQDIKQGEILANDDVIILNGQQIGTVSWFDPEADCPMNPQCRTIKCNNFDFDHKKSHNGPWNYGWQNGAIKSIKRDGKNVYIETTY